MLRIFRIDNKVHIEDDLSNAGLTLPAGDVIGFTEQLRKAAQHPTPEGLIIFEDATSGYGFSFEADTIEDIIDAMVSLVQIDYGLIPLTRLASPHIQ